MEWLYFSMAALWAMGCAITSTIICINIYKMRGWRFLSAALFLILPIGFLVGAIPTLALRESYSQIIETLYADEWACTEGHFEPGHTIATHTSQVNQRFICTRYERKN